MSKRGSGLPYTVLSCCMSLDGYLDGPSGPRWVLSDAADLDRVDGLRASCDAILVGAGTVRADDPRLVIRDRKRRQDRVALGLDPDPVKVTVTRSADLDPAAAFFAVGECPKLAYCPAEVQATAQDRFGNCATVVAATDPIDLRWMSADLGTRGIRRLLVEGGSSMLTQFLVADLADELQLAIAPLFVGDRRAPRFVDDGRFPWDRERRARLVSVAPVGDVVVHRYALSERSEVDE